MNSLKGMLVSIDLNSQSYDPEWAQFIEDHMIEIRNKATKIIIPAGEMFRYRYRPEDFLDSRGIDISLSWIMLMINQIPDKLSFVDLTEVLIPNPSQILKLKESFNTVKQTIDDPDDVDLLNNV